MYYVPTKSSVAREGDQFGRYTVKGIYKRDTGYAKYALVQCDCGSPERYVKIDCLRSGDSRSCGCLHKEAVTKHGVWSSPIFARWNRMMSRCYDPKDRRYDRYGGRGITVCERWHDVRNFVADMEPTFAEEMSLDRIDNDKGYSPENCRWADVVTQRRNRSDLVMIEFQGETLCLQDWATKLGIIYGTLWDRYKQGWSTERMLTTPVRVSKKLEKNSS